jgi:hypothetical protein
MLTLLSVAFLYNPLASRVYVGIRVLHGDSAPAKHEKRTKSPN